MHKSPITIEDIFNQTIDRVKRGEDFSVAISEYPAEVQAQLTPLFSVTSALSKLPTKIAPAPLKRKMFLEHRQAKLSRVGTMLSNFNFAPFTVIAIVLLVSGAAYGSTQAHPGEPLFAVRKAYEAVRLTLTTDPQNRAAFQIEIANQRLADAQEVLSLDTDSESKEQTIKELDSQTTLALNNVKEVAATVNPDNHDLLSKVEQITENKNTLVAKVSPETAKESEEKSKVALDDIKKIIAATDEQQAAKITALKTVTTSGTVTSIKGNLIIVDGNEFEVQLEAQTTDEVTASDPSVESVAKPNKTPNSIVVNSIKDLIINDEVTIITKIQENKNIAISIRRLPRILNPSAAVNNSNPDAPSKTDPPLEKPQDTFGGFILEPIVQPESE